MTWGLLSCTFSVFFIKSSLFHVVSFEISNKFCPDFYLVCFWNYLFRIFNAFNALRYASFGQFDALRSNDHAEYYFNDFFGFETRTLYRIYAVTI